MRLGATAPIPRAQQALLGLVALWGAASLYKSPVPDLAPLQNLPTLFVAGALLAALRRRPMPTSAVACIAAFLALHTLGGRHAYSYVPYDDWAAAMGLPRPSELFGFTRNHYDRLVHFSFGLLLVHPLSAALRDHGRVSSRLALYVAVEFVFAASALYEIFEWALTMILAGADVETYNGQQGDIWDAQKDMAMAGIGALIAAALIKVRRHRRP